MNRYVPPSKATPTTRCQKCLKLGHYSYECTASNQQRPYVSRPSRTQQLLNPKLLPNLTSDAPNDLMRKSGIADELLAKAEHDRGRKRQRLNDDDDKAVSRSASSSSFDSVSTISTNRSKSPPPNGSSSRAKRKSVYSKGRHCLQSRSRSLQSQTSDETPDREQAPERRVRQRLDSRTSQDRARGDRSRSTDPREDSRSSSVSSNMTGSSAGTRPPRALEGEVLYQQSNTDGGHSKPGSRANPDRKRPESRILNLERELSPHSRRLALTQAMNM